MSRVIGLGLTKFEKGLYCSRFRVLGSLLRPSATQGRQGCRLRPPEADYAAAGRVLGFGFKGSGFKVQRFAVLSSRSRVMDFESLLSKNRLVALNTAILLSFSRKRTILAPFQWT